MVNATPCSDEKIPMIDCAAYTIVNLSSEEPMFLKQTTAAEADYENPDAVCEYSFCYIHHRLT